MPDTAALPPTLLIGGAGFIGANLARYLHNAGTALTFVLRPSTGTKNIDDIPFRSYVCDLSQTEHLAGILKEALENCRLVFNLATVSSSAAADESPRRTVNVEAAGIVARMAREAGVRLVHVSSSTAVGFPTKPPAADETFAFNGWHDGYATSKRRGEDKVLTEVAQGLDGVIAIPCSTVGALAMKPQQMKLFRGIAAGSTFFAPPGGLCLTGIHDLVRGLVLCATKGRTGERYLLGGTNISYLQYMEGIAQATGGKGPRLVMPAALLPHAGAAFALLCRLLGRSCAIDRATARMITLPLHYSSAKAKRELGYTISDWRKILDETVVELRRQKLLEPAARRS